MSQSFEEAFNLLCGDKISDGMSRTVFECAILPGYVVKVEDLSRHFQNVIEWETWRTVKDTQASRWFAECRWISPTGTVLIQERTRPASTHDLLDRVPAWFTDLKPENWGLVDRRGNSGKQFLVCHDYGTSLALQEGTATKRMRKAQWLR